VAVFATLFSMGSMIPEVLSFGRTGFGDELLLGTYRTLLIAGCAYALGLVLGLLGATAKLYGSALAKWIAGFYTSVVRGIPELILILFLYFAGTRGISALGEAVGYGPIDINGTLAGILVLGFVQGAYSTEVIRGAIEAVPVGQIEAARAYGMSPVQSFRRIILPAMLPNALPGLSNLWLSVIKDTTLVVVTGSTPELLQYTKNAAGYTKRYFMFYFVAGLIYLAITLVSNQLLDLLERRLRKGQRTLE
jgi:polar amino acid transport system permease protein